MSTKWTRLQTKPVLGSIYWVNVEVNKRQIKVLAEVLDTNVYSPHVPFRAEIRLLNSDDECVWVLFSDLWIRELEK